MLMGPLIAVIAFHPILVLNSFELCWKLTLYGTYNLNELLGLGGVHY